MLSAEQQKTIEESLWVVNDVLKNLGLQGDEDLRQEANLYLCRCLERFNPSYNTKWTTYAYKNIFMFVKLCNRRQAPKQAQCIDFTSYADNMDDIVIARPQGVLDMAILKKCTPEEKDILRLRYLGYKVQEIGKMYGCSRQYVSQKLKEIRRKVIKLLKNS